MHRNLDTNIDVTFRYELEFREARVAKLESDTAIACIHGMSHDGRFFVERMKEMSFNEGIRCVSVSLEGHGLSQLQAKSINDLSIKSYRDNIHTANAYIGEESKKIVQIMHSMGARCGFENLYMPGLSEKVAAKVFINPVPSGGVLGSATWATIKDAIRFQRATPYHFLNDLARGNIEHFMKSNPDRTMSLFFSSDPGEESRLENLDPKTFCEDYLFPESRKAVWEMNWPSKVSPKECNIPVFIITTEGDRVISRSKVHQMAEDMRNAGHHAVYEIHYPEISHETPMDIGGRKVFEDIFQLFKNHSLL